MRRHRGSMCIESRCHKVLVRCVSMKKTRGGNLRPSLASHLLYMIYSSTCRSHHQVHWQTKHETVKDLLSVSTVGCVSSWVSMLQFHRLQSCERQYERRKCVMLSKTRMLRFRRNDYVDSEEETVVYPFHDLSRVR